MKHETQITIPEIAITGVSCRFAGAATPGSFWRHIIAQRSDFTPLSTATQLDIGEKPLFANPMPAHAAQLGALYAFRPGAQTIPRQLNTGENQDTPFAVQLAMDAMTDAGLRPSNEGHRGTVRMAYAPPFNASTVNWLEHTFFLDQTMDIIRRFFPDAPSTQLDSVRERLIEALPAPNAESFLSGMAHRLADWVARSCSFLLDATSCDAGCLSFAAALSQAMDDLTSRRADVALAGALMPPLSKTYLQGISGSIKFTKAHELHPFSITGDGTLPGEGGACFILKRRQDALEAHDHIYALVKSVTLTSGANPLALALERAQFNPSDIGLIEADGLGEAEADAREANEFREMWGEHKRGDSLVGIGSVKGNIGHLLTAACAPAVLKVALALKMRVLPPQVQTTTPMEALANITSGTYLLNGARPWLAANRSTIRRAAVCANDLTGRRAAVLLQEEPEELKIKN